MAEHFRIEDAQDNAPAQIEDFLATCAHVFIAANGRLWQCEAEQRGGAIWLAPEEEVPIGAGERAVLCCPYGHSLYRFNLDVLEAEPDRIICTKAADEPLGKRVSIRIDADLAVSLVPDTGGSRSTVTGRSRNVSRAGLLLATPEQLDIGSTWTAEVHLDSNTTLTIEAEVVREATPAAAEGHRWYGVRFLDFPVEEQRHLLDFLLSHAALRRDQPG